MRETLDARRARARALVRALKKAYPDAKIALDFTTPLELLAATILAAQCTDERVNRVTPALFAKYRTARDWAAADPATLEREVHSTGFYRAKARALVGMARALVERHGGDVPRAREALVRLPGVGLKTANVVLGNAFGKSVGIVVDTHVSRVSGRLGFTRNSDPVKIESDLMKLIPQKEWTKFAHRVILHGRTLCVARKPKCRECLLNELCPSAEEPLE